jgi:predicted dehydrogenase
MKTVGMGLVGPGFVALHHIDAVRRLGDVDVVAIAGSTLEGTRRKAQHSKIERAYGDFNELIADPDIQVVHNTTPNHLHFAVSMAAFRAGKHVISDKPLAPNSTEGKLLRDAALASGVAHVVTFNYRGNPMIQQARSMVANEEAGDVSFVHGHYLQDWMADPNVYSWRSDPSKGGASSALGDIGSHWCDLAEHVSGLRIDSVLADLSTVIPTRYSTGTSAEAFSQENHGNLIEVKVSSEDVASVLLRFTNGAKGCFSVGQVLPGHKNDLQLEVNGRKLSLKWLQEYQNDLWIGRHRQPNSVMAKDPGLLSNIAKHYAHLPAGHQESWSDAFFNVIRDAYEWVREKGRPEAKPAALATFEDGYRSTCLVDAMLRSHASGSVWTKVEHVSASVESLQVK